MADMLSAMGGKAVYTQGEMEGPRSCLQPTTYGI